MSSYWLQITRGAALVTKFRLVEPRVVLGRAPECDVMLRSNGVSRHHAELLAAGDGWVIRDLASRNGVAVNGERIARERRIEAGDTVQIDAFELVLFRELALAEDHSELSRTTVEFGPPKPVAGYLSALVAFNGALLASDARQQRQRLLCRLLTGPELRGRTATVIQVRRDDPGLAPELPVEPSLAEGCEAPPISRTVLRAVLSSRGAVLSMRPASEAPASATLVDEQEATLALPLIEGERELEILYVTLPEACGTGEWRVMVTMAASFYRQAEDVWAAREAMQAQIRLSNELQRAHDLQMRLVPPDFKIGRIDVAFGFEPCKGVGGDYIDAIAMTDGRVLLVAMDVAGKGMDAALIASGLHTTVHICAGQWFTLTDMISTLNHYLIATWDVLTSVTVAASVLDPRSGVIESINCGHPSPLIVGADGRTRELAAFETVPLGFMELDVATRKDRLRPGEMLAFYSDGLSELFDERDSMLGAEGVATYLSEARAEAGLDARAQVAALQRRLAAFRGHAQPSDDISCILALSLP